jgi:prepilin-type N-terminal cleavage/methylation domain-containing protein
VNPHPLKDERGFTLPEMLVTIMVMIMVLFALYSIFDISLRLFDFGNDKVEAVENARLGLERMEREIRAAYPHNRAAEQDYVLLDPDDPTQEASPLATNQITFGNDLDGDRKLTCLSATTCEYITYKLNSSAPYTLQRVNTATPNSSAGEPVIEFVNGPGGLTFTYLTPNDDGDLVTTTDPSEVTVVRARLQINKDGRVQNLTTNITLRNRTL